MQDFEEYKIPLRYRFIIWASNNFIKYTLASILLGIMTGYLLSDKIEWLWYKILIIVQIG